MVNNSSSKGDPFTSNNIGSSTTMTTQTNSQTNITKSKNKLMKMEILCFHLKRFVISLTPSPRWNLNKVHLVRTPLRSANNPQGRSRKVKTRLLLTIIQSFAASALMHSNRESR